MIVSSNFLFPWSVLIILHGNSIQVFLWSNSMLHDTNRLFFLLLFLFCFFSLFFFLLFLKSELLLLTLFAASAFSRSAFSLAACSFSFALLFLLNAAFLYQHLSFSSHHQTHPLCQRLNHFCVNKCWRDWICVSTRCFININTLIVVIVNFLWCVINQQEENRDDNNRKDNSQCRKQWITHLLVRCFLYSWKSSRVGKWESSEGCTFSSSRFSSTSSSWMFVSCCFFSSFSTFLPCSSLPNI